LRNAALDVEQQNGRACLTRSGPEGNTLKRHNRTPTGHDDSEPVLAALLRNDDTGWIAAEPLIYAPDGPTTAAEVAEYLGGVLKKMNAPARP